MAEVCLVSQVRENRPKVLAPVVLSHKKKRRLDYRGATSRKTPLHYTDDKRSIPKEKGRTGGESWRETVKTDRGEFRLWDRGVLETYPK